MRKLTNKKLKEYALAAEQKIKASEEMLNLEKTLVSSGFVYNTSGRYYFFQSESSVKKMYEICYFRPMQLDLNTKKTAMTIKFERHSDVVQVIEILKEFATANIQINKKESSYYGKYAGQFIFRNGNLVSDCSDSYTEIMIYPSIKDKSILRVDFLKKGCSDSDLPKDFEPFTNITKVRNNFTKCTTINTVDIE